MDDQEHQRLRPPPEERFAGPQHPFDLNAVATRLRQEVRTPGVAAGHRQASLYKHGPTSLAFFIFPAQTRLAPHRTRGTVIIQALTGRLTVNAEGRSHDLPAGALVVLAAGVQHEVVAQEESEMLLTVHLDPRPVPSA